MNLKQIENILSSCADSVNIYFDFIHTNSKEKEKRRKMYEERYSICQGCTIYDGGICSRNKSRVIEGVEYRGCGCMIICKAAKKENKCPANLW
jgi:hypothetical protein